VPAEPGWAARAEATAHVNRDGPLSDEVAITGDDGHHLARARRVQSGEIVTVGDGTGSWRAYRVANVERRELTLEADGAIFVEPRLVPALTVAFALTKGEKPETVVARLTELGVDRIVPFVAERSIVRWDDARATAAVDRFQRVAHEAAMQSRRARRPVVESPRPITDLVSEPGLVVADPDGEPVAALSEPTREGWTLVVGPEGGLSPTEQAALAGAARLAVGPYVLRAETAAIAAAAALTGRRRPDTP
jgi:16S rRNA (uracil1498-N3)-methyltransferase